MQKRQPLSMKERPALAFLSDAVLYAIVFLGALGVVEAVERAHQIAGDAADALEGAILLGAAAVGAGVADDAVVAARA